MAPNSKLAPDPFTDQAPEAALVGAHRRGTFRSGNAAPGRRGDNAWAGSGFRVWQSSYIARKKQD
jgi:hypothetical protein